MTASPDRFPKRCGFLSGQRLSVPAERRIVGKIPMPRAGYQLQLCRKIRGTGSRGEQLKGSAVGQAEMRRCGVLDLDHALQMVVGQMRRDRLRHSAKPLQQVEGVERLVDHHPAALGCPFSAPCARGIVIRVAPPCDHAERRRNALLPGGCLEAEKIRLIAVLQTYAEHSGAFRLRRLYGAQIRFADAERLLAQDIHSARQCRAAHRRVQVMRRADVQDIRVLAVKQLLKVGVNRNRQHEPRKQALRAAFVGVTDRRKRLPGGKNPRHMIRCDCPATDHGGAEGLRPRHLEV